MFLCLALCLINSGVVSAEDPRFDLRLTNRNYLSSNEGYFDIVLKQVNPGQVDFLYAGGRYVIKLDTFFLSEHLNYSYSKDTSTYGMERIPPQYIGALTKQNDILKLDFREQVPLGGEPVISGTSGTLVARIKFYNPDLYSTSCLLEEQFQWITWSPEEFTQLYYRRNGITVPINNNNSSFSTYDLCISTLCCLDAPLPPPVRVSPENNSEDLVVPVILKWRKGFSVNYSAHLQVAFDSEFNNIVYEKSLTAPNGMEDINVTLDSITSPGSYYWRVRQGGIPPQGAYNEPWKFTIRAPSVSLKLTVIPEGLCRRENFFPFEMKTYLRNYSAPYELVDSCIFSITDSSFENILNFSNANSGKYYIVVKAKNTLETWSREGGDSLLRGYELNEYDFSESLISAFGNNLIQKDSMFCIFSGDVNQDYSINPDDVIPVYNNLNFFASGYVSTDLTGDDLTDLTDLLISYNNSIKFVSVMKP
ncbi:MAG: hypothetical protein IPL53_02785 [Ignavibacteria bacterium]|nr:hypothetical protein [Ignavibacteria bacterium]